ncbi:MAG: universal stress protein [Alphaproteobacteria bacterium]|nr:universal stress protein [Alphaproteobacteria bacterium]
MSDNDLSPIGRFNTVLLVTDLSEFSAGADGVAVQFCRRLGAHLHVLSIVHDTGEAGWIPPESEDRVVMATVDKLKNLEAAAHRMGVTCTTHTRGGNETARIAVEEARALHTDLIVVGRRDRSKLGRKLLGSLAVQILERTHCPVMVVPRHAGMWDSVLVADDGSRFGAHALKAAELIAKACGAAITVLAVRMSADTADEQDARIIVDRAVQHLGDVGVKADGVVAEGAPDKVILKTASERNSGLIVLGKFGRTGMARRLFGGIGETVKKRAQVPVLVARGR